MFNPNMNMNMNMNMPIQNQAMMGMHGMQNMQNQFMNYNDMQIKILIDPYLEKIKKLEEEIREKDLQITQLKFKLMQNNNMNQMNMVNIPINQMNNGFCQMSNQMNINNRKFLSIKTKIENGKEIVIQSISDDKFDKVIDKICSKTLYEKANYEFYVVTKHKAKRDLTVEENGIQGETGYIFVSKKDTNDNNNYNKTNIAEKNIPISGEVINLNFNATSGLKVVMPIGLNNTLQDTLIKYCQKIGVPPSLIGEKLVFILNAEKLDSLSKETIGQIGLKNGTRITVLDQGNVIGA
jgi:hypothetical protein